MRCVHLSVAPLVCPVSWSPKVRHQGQFLKLNLNLFFSKFKFQVAEYIVEAGLGTKPPGGETWEYFAEANMW